MVKKLFPQFTGRIPEISGIDISRVSKLDFSILPSVGIPPAGSLTLDAPQSIAREVFHFSLIHENFSRVLAAQSAAFRAPCPTDNSSDSPRLKICNYRPKISSSHFFYIETDSRRAGGDKWPSSSHTLTNVIPRTSSKSKEGGQKGRPRCCQNQSQIAVPSNCRNLHGWGKRQISRFVSNRQGGADLPSALLGWSRPFPSAAGALVPMHPPRCLRNLQAFCD